MIPVSQPSLDDSDLNAAINAIKSGWISSLGSELRSFESEFAEYVGTKFCLSCSNGTTALQLALSAAGVGPGDEIIIPNLTFAAVANAVLAVGGVPVCVDVELTNWNISSIGIRNALSDKTKAIIVVHTYGVPADVIQIRNDYPGLFIIEDCAEAHGAEVDNAKVGSLGDISTFSFYANKIITTGEGGCVVTNNDVLYERLKVMRDHGMDPNKRFSHLMPGFNYRMTNVQGAIGRTQLHKINDLIAERDAQEVKYDNQLLKIGFVNAHRDVRSRSVNWLYTRLVPDWVNRDGLIFHLRERGVETRPMFRPINSFTYIKSDKRNDVKLMNSEIISSQGISLPTFNGLKNSDQEYVIKCVREYVG